MNDQLAYRFQLSGNLENLGNHLIKYDTVRKPTAENKPKKPRKPNPFPLGLPPIDKLIPNDVLPYGAKRKEAIIRTISRCDPKYRYKTMSYPEVTDTYPQIGKEGHLFKDTDRRVTWDGHRVKRNVFIYHFEGMWTCLWIPHTNDYVYGYSFAFKDNKSTQVRYESHPSKDFSPDRRVFCRKGTGRYMNLEGRDGEIPNHFYGWSWNDCEKIKVGKSDWRYKTVYVTKDMIKKGHFQDPTMGIFAFRPIESRQDKNRILNERLFHFRNILRKSLPQWHKDDNCDYYQNREDNEYNRCRRTDLFDRLVRDTVGSVIRDRFMMSQKNWKDCGRHESAMIEAGNKDLILKDNFKWDVHSLKDLLYRLTQKDCRTLYERRHNIGHALWKEKGWIEQPFFRKLLHETMESVETRHKHSHNRSQNFVVVPIRQLVHFIDWIDHILDIWPDTPVDYFKNYQEDLMNTSVPWFNSWFVRGSRTQEVNKEVWLYLRRMPVKTLFEYIRKNYQDTRPKRPDELYGRGRRDNDWQADRESHAFRLGEFNDTVGMLAGVMEDRLRKEIPPQDLPSPRRWRIGDFHNFMQGQNFKIKTKKEKLPQDLFPKPLHIKYMDIVSDFKTWLDSDQKYSTLCFFQPQDTHQLADWGKAVHNCVGQRNYAEGIKRKQHFIVLIMFDRIPRYTVQLKLSDQVLSIDKRYGIKDVSNRDLDTKESEFIELAFNHAFQLRTKQLEESK